MRLHYDAAKLRRVQQPAQFGRRLRLLNNKMPLQFLSEHSFGLNQHVSVISRPAQRHLVKQLAPKSPLPIVPCA